MKRVHVFEGEGEWGSQGWPPEEAIGALEWFKAKLAQIPPEHMDSARVEFGARQDYDSAVAVIEIYYDRPETAQELAEKEAKESAARWRRERDEREALARLIAKYGPPA